MGNLAIGERVGERTTLKKLDLFPTLLVCLKPSDEFDVVNTDGVSHDNICSSHQEL